MNKKLIALVAVFFVIGGGSVSAASNSDLTQTINAGSLTTDILDGSRNAVAAPTVAMASKSFSFDCQAGASASSGTFGSTTERAYVINGDAADAGWSLAIAATGGAAAKWSNTGVTTSYDYNDPTGTTAGCADGADTDTLKGQLKVDPSVSTLTTDCSSCVTTNVTKGSAASFDEIAATPVNSITLLNAAGTSDDIWRGYLTGVGLSQTVPAETPADAYKINLTLTVTAN